VIRSFDPAPFNAIANDATVRPWLGGTIELDLTPVVSHADNICLLTDKQDGGYILTKLAEGLYSAHTLALPSARGRPMLRLMREGFRALFTATDCFEVCTFIPDGADHASTWANLAGFKTDWRREAFFLLGPDVVGGEFRSLTYADWVLRDNRNREAGRLFHAQLEDAQGHENHPEDEIHDYWVGATLACAAEGQLVKGIRQYNRYALITGYLPATIKSLDPPIVDIGTAVVELANGGLQISLAA
jgi:hypothetical protein